MSGGPYLGLLMCPSVQSVRVPVLTNKNNIYVAVQSAATVLTVCDKSKGLAEPLDKSAAGSAPTISAAGSEPSQSAKKGSADPSKTASTKVLKVDVRPGSTARKSSLQGVRRIVMDGASVKINSDGILNPSRSHQPKKPPPPPKPTKVLSDRHRMISL